MIICEVIHSFAQHISHLWNDIWMNNFYSVLATSLSVYRTCQVEKPSECLLSSEIKTLKGQRTVKYGHFTSNQPTQFTPYNLSLHSYTTQFRLSASEIYTATWLNSRPLLKLFFKEYVVDNGLGCLWLQFHLFLISKVDCKTGIGLPWMFCWHDTMLVFLITINAYPRFRPWRLRHFISGFTNAL